MTREIAPPSSTPSPSPFAHDDDPAPAANQPLAPHDDPIAQQIELELRMTELGRARLANRATSARRRGSEADTGYGRRIISAEVARLAAAITDKIEGKPRGRRPAAVERLSRVSPETTALLVLRAIVNTLSAEPRAAAIAARIGDLIEDEARFSALRKADVKLYDRVARRAEEVGSYKAKRRLFLDASAAAGGRPWKDWPRVEKDRLGVTLLALAVEVTGLFDLIDVRNGEKTVKRVTATPETLAWIETELRQGGWLSPHYEPMVTPPLPWRAPGGGGYLTRHVRPLDLVKTRDRAYLAALSEKDLSDTAPIVLTAVNAAQETPWRINGRLLRVMETLAADRASPEAEAAKIPQTQSWGAQSASPRGAPAEGMDGAAPDSASGQPHADGMADAEAEAEARRLRRRRREAERQRLSKCVAFDLMLSAAQRFRRMERLYFPMQLDFRGRLYAAPAFNPQGPDAMRALLEFADAKPLGPEGWKWLAIHLCNCGDFLRMSKAPLARRVEWVFENEQRVLTVAADPLADLWWTEADQPWQFLAACFEWAGFVDEGEDFASRLPIALDGSCSGIQHFSLALRDPVGGAAVNLRPQPRPADIYQEVADAANALLREDLSSDETIRCGTEPDGSPRLTPVAALARQWLAFGVTRAVCKRPTMTYGYGARAYGFTDQILEDTLTPAYLAYLADEGASETAWPFTGGGFDAAVYLAARVTEAVERVVLKAAEAMRWLQRTASIAAESGAPLEWTTPDGFPVRQAYPDTRPRRVKATIGGRTLRLTLREECARLDKRRQRQGVAPNFVHSLDACHLRLTVARAVEEGVRHFALIHDSFGVHAADTPRFFQLIRETLVEMYDAVDVIATFRTEIADLLPDAAKEKLDPPPEPGALDLAEVLESDFCFA